MPVGFKTGILKVLLTKKKVDDFFFLKHACSL